jgi:hypothetical protein
MLGWQVKRSRTYWPVKRKKKELNQSVIMSLSLQFHDYWVLPCKNNLLGFLHNSILLRIELSAQDSGHTVMNVVFFFFCNCKWSEPLLSHVMVGRPGKYSHPQTQHKIWSPLFSWPQRSPIEDRHLVIGNISCLNYTTSRLCEKRATNALLPLDPSLFNFKVSWCAMGNCGWLRCFGIWGWMRFCQGWTWSHPLICKQFFQIWNSESATILQCCIPLAGLDEHKVWGTGGREQAAEGLRYLPNCSQGNWKHATDAQVVHRLETPREWNYGKSKKEIIISSDPVHHQEQPYT